MTFSQELLKVFLSVSLLTCPSSAVPLHSLWGKAVDLGSRCGYWKLKPDVHVPALREFTACLSVKFELEVIPPWTAFIYRHPEAQYIELGLGGRPDGLVVWLFGTEWSTYPLNLPRSQWHSLCVTWSHARDRPTLYVNGMPERMWTAHSVNSCPFCPSAPARHQLAPSGTLFLGKAHGLNNGNFQVIPSLCMKGTVSLFRLWSRERSQQEVNALFCSEGDVLTWKLDNWDTWMAPVHPDVTLSCEWSHYEVRLEFAITKYDGSNTDVHAAREIAQQWLGQVLPTDFNVQRLSVFQVNRSSSEDSPIKTSSEERSGREDSRERPVGRIPPLVTWFGCLLDVSVSPSKNVASVQEEMSNRLLIPYPVHSDVLQLLALEETIYTTPVENFSTATSRPPVVTTASSPVTTATLTTASPPATSPSTTTSKTTADSATISTTDAASTSSITSATPANISDLYFEVNANVSVTGGDDPQRILSMWLTSSLPSDTMKVLNLQLLPKVQRYHPNLKTADGEFLERSSRESCIFQVQVMMLQSDPQEMEEQIRHLLFVPYNNGSIRLQAEDITISRILILNCDAETSYTRKGQFQWHTTPGGETATQQCPKDPQSTATRHCKLCLSTRWMPPDLGACPLVVETIPDLDHVEVTPDNALDVLQMIQELLSNRSTISYQELVTVLTKLEDVLNCSVITPDLGQAVINVISDILESGSDLLPFTNTILNITEAVGDRLVGFDGYANLVAPAIAISVVDVVPSQFRTLTFGVSSDSTGTKPEIFINRHPFDSTVAFVSLPSVLEHSLPQLSLNQSPARIQFQFYGIPMLFMSSQKGQILNTFVVSASVTNVSSPIKDLDEDVKITLHHLSPNTLNNDMQCVYWNFNKNDGHGGWDDDGCRKYNSSSNYTTCLCNHLTHFGVLLDVSRTPIDPVNEQILTIITYAGCGLSSLFLGITVVTYTVFEKLRRDYPSQILINLCLALLGLNLVFLVNSWLSSWGLYALCVAAASALHFFLLASFTWMGLEAVNMYFALVKVFNVYVPSYILKFCVLGWGLPLIICILVLVVNREAYGSQLYTDAQSVLELVDGSDSFCWLPDNVTFYVSVVAYAVLIFLFNIAVFVVVLIQIRHMRVNSPAGTRSGLMHDLKGVASLTLLLGLTWTVGFFTWGPARIILLYLFSLLNTLQGLFIFLFHCLMKENVRKQWRIHLCFGRFRLDEYSEWSNSASAGAVVKPRLNASVPSVHSVQSSSTESTSSKSSNPSQGDPGLPHTPFCGVLGFPSSSKKLRVSSSAFPGGDELDTQLEESQDDR